MNALIFRPLDSLFFRDGRPYHRFEAQTDVVSQFPPFSPTLIGAARAAFARSLGWNGKGAWPERISNLLGDGPCLGTLDFSGPYLLRSGQPVFPVPLALLKAKSGEYIRLKPGSAHRCDLGEPGETVHLPEPVTTAEGAKEAKGWITAEGLAAVLAGGVPGAGTIIENGGLFRQEPRIGHVRDAATRTVNDDHALYSSAHVRLASEVTLALNAAGLPATIQPASPIPLGGESRLAWIERREQPIGVPDTPPRQSIGGKVRYIAVLLTPLDIGEIGAPKPNQPYAGLPGILVTACLGRIQRAGGWDGRNADGKGEPLALRPLLPAGSVLFMEAGAEHPDSIHPLHGRKVGARTEWGFGQIVIGTWE